VTSLDLASSTSPAAAVAGLAVDIAAIAISLPRRRSLGRALVGCREKRREKEGKGPPPSLFETNRSFEGRES
jgi:hypothetical protein